METGAVLAVEQTVARSANVVIRLPKATTIEQRQRWARVSDESPAGPLLSWTPGSSGMHGRELGCTDFGFVAVAVASG